MMAEDNEQFIGGNGSNETKYVEIIGKMRLQQRSIDDVQKQIDRIEVDFKESIKEHKASNDRVVEAIKQEVATLSSGFAEMTDNVKRIQYILLGGALFYVLDSVGLKAFLIKIMGA